MFERTYHIESQREHPLRIELSDEEFMKKQKEKLNIVSETQKDIPEVQEGIQKAQKVSDTTPIIKLKESDGRTKKNSGRVIKKSVSR
jgi:hypothetical protein